MEGLSSSNALQRLIIEMKNALEDWYGANVVK